MLGSQEKLGVRSHTRGGALCVALVLCEGHGDIINARPVACAVGEWRRGVGGERPCVDTLTRDVGKVLVLLDDAEVGWVEVVAPSVRRVELESHTLKRLDLVTAGVRHTVVEDVARQVEALVEAVLAPFLDTRGSKHFLTSVCERSGDLGTLTDDVEVGGIIGWCDTRRGRCNLPVETAHTSDEWHTLVGVAICASTGIDGVCAPLTWTGSRIGNEPDEGRDGVVEGDVDERQLLLGTEWLAVLLCVRGVCVNALHEVFVLGRGEVVALLDVEIDASGPEGEAKVRPSECRVVGLLGYTNTSQIVVDGQSNVLNALEHDDDVEVETVHREQRKSGVGSLGEPEGDGHVHGKVLAGKGREFREGDAVVLEDGFFETATGGLVKLLGNLHVPTGHVLLGVVGEVERSVLDHTVTETPDVSRDAVVVSVATDGGDVDLEVEAGAKVTGLGHVEGQLLVCLLACDRRSEGAQVVLLSKVGNSAV